MFEWLSPSPRLRGPRCRLKVEGWGEGLRKVILPEVLGLTRCFNFAGGSPAASDFLFLAQKKVTKEKGTLPRRPFGVPCVARVAGRLRNSREGWFIVYAMGGICW